MSNNPSIKRIPTGVRNLDAILGGGIPKSSIIVVGGPPGSAKTILSQEIGFYNASEGKKVLFIQTLSEPTVKTLLYLQQFKYFDAEKLKDSVKFIDLGVLLKTKGLDASLTLIMEHVKKETPFLTVIDSFRAFDDLAGSKEDLRKFTYNLLINLIAWESTALLLGEFGMDEIKTNPLFSIVDGILMMSQEEISGEHVRFLQVIKLRGAAHNRDKQAFVVSDRGIEIYAPRITLKRKAHEEVLEANETRVKTGIAILDSLLGPGIPRGSTLIVAGRSGTGKTILLLEFLYRGALEQGEKGLFISFQEPEERLYMMARSLGWDFRAAVKQGLIDILYVPQPEIMVEAQLIEVQEKMIAHSYKRIAIDSISSFLYKVTNPQLSREKVYQIVTIVQNANAVCLMAGDAASRGKKVAPFAGEEGLVDGLIFLSAKKDGRSRQRYIEVCKLRSTDHILGNHRMTIGKDGIKDDQKSEIPLMEGPVGNPV